MKVNAKSGDMADTFGRIYKMTALFKKDKKTEKVVEEVPVVAEAEEESHEGKRKVWRHGGYVWEDL